MKTTVRTYVIHNRWISKMKEWSKGIDVQDFILTNESPERDENRSVGIFNHGSLINSVDKRLSLCNQIVPDSDIAQLLRINHGDTEAIIEDNLRGLHEYDPNLVDLFFLLRSDVVVIPSIVEAVSTATVAAMLGIPVVMVGAQVSSLGVYAQSSVRAFVTDPMSLAGVLRAVVNRNPHGKLRKRV